MRSGLLLLGALVVLHSACPAAAQGACSKTDFESVVDEAASALRTLAQQNTPPFQAKLRQLKAKRGWSDDQFLKEAEPLVRDDKIADFDQKSETLLLSITDGGQAGAAAGAPMVMMAQEGGARMVVMGGGPAAPGSQPGRYRMGIFIRLNNLTNHANPGGYSGAMTSDLFGKPTSYNGVRSVNIGMNFGF